MIRWSFAMLRNCTAARYRINKTRMVRLAEYSRDSLRALRAATGIAYDERMRGTLQLFRTQKQFDGSASDIAVLRESGVAFELLDRRLQLRGARAARVQKFVGGLLLPGDQTGDCHRFTQRLASPRQRRRLHPRRHPRDTQRRRHHRRHHRQRRHRCRRHRSRRRLFAVAARADRRADPVYRSRATDHRADQRRCQRARIDGHGGTHKVAVTRLGDRIRAGGTAELAGTLRLRRAPENAGARRQRPLPTAVTSTAPVLVRFGPMTPDSTP
jgi:D-amino-acid dehydrogenase